MKISILSAVWNEGAHVAEMIESVQAQDHQDWEICFVDDASTDDTVEIIERFAEQDTRVRLVGRGEKLGVVGAFNKAWEHSTGELISLLAGDDRLSPGSLTLRAQGHPAGGEPSVSFWKLRTFSDDPKFDNLVLPKGNAASRSGACITMNRALAEIAFPIPTQLGAEDIWLGVVVEDQARRRAQVPQVIMEYRIHEHNTNPRRATFPEMTERMHRINDAYPELLKQPWLQGPARTTVEQFALAEELRHQGKVWSLLTRVKLPLVDRLAFASQANRLLFAVRTRFFGLFSGRRGG